MTLVFGETHAVLGQNCTHQTGERGFVKVLGEQIVA